MLNPIEEMFSLRKNNFRKLTHRDEYMEINELIIHCSGHGTCIDTIGTTSSTGPQCICEEGWSGSACNKDSQQLQQAQKQLEAVLPKLLNTAPTISTVGSQLLAVQIATKEPDLIATGSTVPSLISKTVVSSYKVVSPSSTSSSSSESPASLRSTLSTIADAAYSLMTMFSSGFESESGNIEQLAEIFFGSIQDMLSGLGSGEISEIDTAMLYVFMETVDSLFDEIFEDEDYEEGEEGNRRILQGPQPQQQQQQQHQAHGERQPSRVLASTSSSTTSDDKKQAALENKVSTQAPFKSTPTIDISKLKQVLSALLSQLKKGKTVKMKTETQYNTASGDFQIPKLTLKVSSQVKFSIQETKTDKNTLASNSNALVTKSVTFSAHDGSKKVDISSLKAPIRMSIPKTTPTTPSSDGSKMYQCSYYDETSRRFLTNGCSFVGENLTHIICECNHATEFAVQINEEALNAFDSIFNKPSLQDLLTLSVQRVSNNKDQGFKLALQKNILARTTTAIYEYTLSRFDFLPIGVTILILVILIALYPIVNFLSTVKRDYFASWSEELVDLTDSIEGVENKGPKAEAKVFWSLYSLFTSRTEKYFSEYAVRTLSFYTEVLNLMGNVMAWTIFLNSQQGKSIIPHDSTPILGYIFVIGVSFGTATLSFYAILGSINLCRIRVLQKHYAVVEADLPSPTKTLAGWELFYTIICILMTLAWLALFAVLSTVLLNSEVKYWLSCCLGAAVFSYLVLDALMVVIYHIFKPKKMLLMLALRTLNSKYILASHSSKMTKKTVAEEQSPSQKVEMKTSPI